MKPFLQMLRVYDSDLLEIMGFCAAHGIVHSDDECFLCAYKTHSSLIETESKEDIETKSKKVLDKPDTWYVYVAAGSIKKPFLIAEPMEYIAFRRMDDRFRLFNFERFRRLVWTQHQQL